MHPDKVDPANLKRLTDLPNVGPACEDDLRRLGFTEPSQLKGKDPLELYQRLCLLTCSRQDPCVLDTLLSITRFLDGNEPQPWWAYTAERKRILANPNPPPGARPSP